MTPEAIKDGGTTAIVCLCVGSKMYIANTGDTRGVMWKDRKAIRVSTDHKPDLHEEEVTNYTTVDF